MNIAQKDAVSPSQQKFYKAAWRWHFYAGLYVIPFFIILALTGMTMSWISYIDGRDGERTTVPVQEHILPVSQQAQAALKAVGDGVLKQYVAPRSENLASIFRVDKDGVATMVVVDPYNATVMEQFPRRSGWYDLADNIHSDLLLGVTGDRMLEIAASLGVILLITGLYMWWPRDTGWKTALLPTFGKGSRTTWKSLHGSLGIWISIIFLFFLISGLSWTGVWGAQLVQAWNSFPAEKWDNVPLSDVTHASMNHGPKEVPWNLELTPMPASGSSAGKNGLAQGLAINVDTMDQLARELGFEGRYQMNIPTKENGVYTFSRDSMSTDSLDPTSDRTVHVDRYSGKILADIRYEDYSWFSKAMAVGIALHMGTMGLWSVMAVTLACLSVLFLCVSSIVMWWKRRPVGRFGISPPPMPKNMPLWQGAVTIALIISLAFPLAGLTLISVFVLDHIILSRIQVLKRAFS
ncbi:MAG: PepSY domain-containing protein [Methylocystaceae bacterium]|nr:PepSY domain-containing protein [Methylocystaceae bacterium]